MQTILLQAPFVCHNSLPGVALPHTIAPFWCSPAHSRPQSGELNGKYDAEMPMLHCLSANVRCPRNGKQALSLPTADCHGSPLCLSRFHAKPGRMGRYGSRQGCCFFSRFLPACSPDTGQTGEGLTFKFNPACGEAGRRCLSETDHETSCFILARRCRSRRGGFGCFVPVLGSDCCRANCNRRHNRRKSRTGRNNSFSLSQRSGVQPGGRYGHQRR